MFFGVLIVLVGLSSLNAQVFVEDIKLTNSQDVTHLRIEYYKTNGVFDANSISYSLWKGKLKLCILHDDVTECFLNRYTCHSCVQN